MGANDDLRYLLTPKAAVVVPAGQAAVTALAVGVTVGSLAWYFDAPNPMALSGLAMGVTFGGAWLIGLSAGLVLAALAFWLGRRTLREEAANTPPAVTRTVIELRASVPRIGCGSSKRSRARR